MPSEIETPVQEEDDELASRGSDASDQEEEEDEEDEEVDSVNGNDEDESENNEIENESTATDGGGNDESMELDVTGGDDSTANDDDDGNDDLPLNTTTDGGGSMMSNNSELDDNEDENEQDDNDDGSSPETETPTTTTTSIKLGGANATNGTPAYALLVGMLDPSNSMDNTDDNESIISIPITRLPITLGKEHETRDPSFVPLIESSSEAAGEGGIKLSQSMCCIFYRDSYGGKLGQYKKGRKKEQHPSEEGGGGDSEKKKSETELDPLDGMIYKPYHDSHHHDNESSTPQQQHHSPDDILRLPNMNEDAPLPTTGFFAIECTGRKIMVNGRVIKKGQSAMLRDGSPIRIAHHCFYFLLPKKKKMEKQHSLKVEVGSSTPIKTEAVVSSTVTKDTTTTAGGAATEKKVDKKNKKKERTTSIGSKSDSAAAAAAADEDTLQPTTKKQRKSTDSEYISFFEEKTDIELLQQLSQKLTEIIWDSEGQRLGSTLATRACRAAAQDPSIQSIVSTEGGVTLREIIDWMNLPTNIFCNYEQSMLSKIEKKSFMISMGKAIIRAGYTKNEFLKGRAFRWNLPKDIAEEMQKKKMKMMSADGGGAGDGSDEVSSLNLAKSPPEQQQQSTLTKSTNDVSLEMNQDEPSKVKGEDNQEE